MLPKGGIRIQFTAGDGDSGRGCPPFSSRSGESEPSWRTILAGPFLSPPHPTSSSPYLHIVILLPQVFISEQLADAPGLPPCRERREVGKGCRSGQHKDISRVEKDKTSTWGAGVLLKVQPAGERLVPAVLAAASC